MNQNLGTTQPRGAVSTRPATQVENELSELQATHEELLKRCFSLRERLQSILHQSSKTAEENVQVPREMLVPLAESLRGIGDQTKDAIQVLADIHDCVEVPFV